LEYKIGEEYLKRIAASVLLSAFLIVSASGADYHIIKKVPIPGQDSWDYLAVDDAARHLYVSHGTKVEILDLDSGERVGSIPTAGVHGIAIVSEMGRGFVSDGKASTVLVFDLKTMKVLQEVASPKDPDAIIYDPASTRVFAFNGESHSATAIDAATGKIAGTVDLGGSPEFAVADGKGYVFDNLEDESQVIGRPLPARGLPAWPWTASIGVCLSAVAAK
jgi:DNA-binding beta-propeller fold protein YncE